MQDHPRWIGTGGTLRKPKLVHVDHDFYFGGKRVPKGAEVKAFETPNFGFVMYRRNDGSLCILKE